MLELNTMDGSIFIREKSTSKGKKSLMTPYNGHQRRYQQVSFGGQGESGDVSKDKAFASYQIYNAHIYI